MAINTALLIAAPMLQDYFVDKSTGLPLSAGVVTCYQDNSRTTLKNWYYQSGTPGNYTYVPLANPLTLGGQGTIVDPNGFDTIPFFYPFSESDNQTSQPYYITVFNSNGLSQFTRQNFPFIAQTPSDTQVPTLKNYIVNNVFWRNIGSLNAQNVTNQVIAPSQHDTFHQPDIRYIKSTTGATETITFTKFALGVDPLTDDITPEFYINHNCTNAQAGETQKVYQFPISLHVKTLESVQAAITIQAQNVGGNANNTISLYIYQFLGTGVTSPSPIQIDEISLTNSFQKFVIPFTFPSAEGATLSNAGDDALFLQIGMPLGVTCNISYTLPSIYLDSNVPTNNFTTYDEVDTIINSPRTGDYRQSMNSFTPFGWVVVDGTIGATGSNASYNKQDGWSLFNLLWNKFPNVNLNGSLYLPIFDNVGTPTTYGVSAIADWNANKQIEFIPVFGKVMIAGSVVNAPSTITGVDTGTETITVDSANPLFIGIPITFSNTGGSLPGNLFANTIYFVSNLIGNTFQVSTTFNNAITKVVINLTTAGTGTNTVLTAMAGTTTGEYQHTQTEPELATHTPTGTWASDHTADVTGSGGVDVYATGGGGAAPSPLPVVMNASGSSTPFNIIQPSIFCNMFFKL